MRRTRPTRVRTSLVAAAGLCAALLAMPACSVTVNGNKVVDTSAAAAANEGGQAYVITSSISRDEKYDAVTLDFTLEDLEAMGYSLGDAVNVKFSNGLELVDVPFFNGYYVKTGEPVVVAYPGQDFVVITYNNMGLFTPAGLKDTDTVEITLSEHGKFLSTQEALSQSYSSDRADYDSDEQFANFRALSGGNLKQDFLFRGASPVDNTHGRAAIVDGLLKKHGIACVVDLADSDLDMQGYFSSSEFLSTYDKDLYDQGRVATLSMSSNYSSDAYKQSVAAGMRHLMGIGGPAYIHCLEGKDRTGFVCTLIEALAGASYDEMRADYMQTYANYYGITEADAPDRYNAVASLYFDSFIEYLCEVEDEPVDKTADFSGAARSYLASAGMSDDEIDQLTALICK